MNNKSWAIGSLILALVIGCLSCNNQKEKEKKVSFETSDKFSLLWEITGNGLQKPSYLYGTIHMYDTSIFKIPQEVFEAIDQCEKFALEVNMDDINQMEMAQRIMITEPDSTLDKLLSPEVYAAIIEIPVLKMMGEQVNNMKPFFLSSYLLIDPMKPMMSVDGDLRTYAKQHEKEMLGLETMDEQLDMIDAITLAEQAQGLADAYELAQEEGLTILEMGAKMFGTLQEAYKEQDFDRFMKLEEEFKMTSSTPSADSALIAIRNINMADRMSDILQQGGSMFTGVGTLHLPDYKGMRGVVTLMKEKGYEMRPILIKL